LIDVGQRPGIGEIIDSNSYALAAAARDAGAEVYRVGVVPDDHARLVDTLEGQLPRADLLITSGGVSAGAFDIVKQALSQLGTVEFIRVAMQPGMPQGFGTLGSDGTPIFCLPGNPVSALVSFEVFVRPAIRLMLGKSRIDRRTVTAIMRQHVSSPAGRRQYRRGLLHREEDGSYSCEPVGGAGSHLLASLARANCLIVIDEEVTEVSEGEPVTVVPLLLTGA
jgi:molybdopterin molybdotransferase